MSREKRLRAALDDTEAADATELLAQLPVADVDLIVGALKASRRAGAADERERRRKLRRNRQRTDDEKIIEAVGAMLRSLAVRSGGTMETLQALNRVLSTDGTQALRAAVRNAREQGYSDPEIARALGVTAQAVGQRFGLRSGRSSPPTRGQSNRQRVLAHYGTTCACCGSTAQLAIDHVNGDGAEHRQAVPSHHFDAWLIEQGFPPGFQTLCRRCNSSKGTGPRCVLSHEDDVRDFE